MVRLYAGVFGLDVAPLMGERRGESRSGMKCVEVDTVLLKDSDRKIFVGHIFAFVGVGDVTAPPTSARVATTKPVFHFDESAEIEASVIVAASSCAAPQRVVRLDSPPHA